MLKLNVGTALIARLFTVVLVMSATTKPAYSGNKEQYQDCWVPQKVPAQGVTRLTYVSPSEVNKREQDLAALELREPKSFTGGGILVFMFGRQTIEKADPKWQNLIVKDAQGAEILRKNLDTPIEVPEPPSQAFSAIAPYWRSQSSIVLPEMLLPAQVFVVDTLLKKRCTFSISADFKIKLVEE